jgi:hypothetical protein
VFARTGDTWEQRAYVKASNCGTNDLFGVRVALSKDGSTMAVAARNEDSEAIGVGGDQLGTDAPNSGAVYIFGRDDDATWTQASYIKATNTDAGDFFGVGLALSGDGRTLAVGSPNERSASTEIGGDQTNDDIPNAGAVYIYSNINNIWSPEAYIKAPNPGPNYYFGTKLDVSGDGDILVVGSFTEAGTSVGLGGVPGDDALPGAGAAYLFKRDDEHQWTYTTYIKAPNPGSGDYFGREGVSLSTSAETLAIGAYHESSDATGVGGDQTSDDAENAGAVYLY